LLIIIMMNNYYLTFETMRVKISSDQEMKDYLETEYNYCGENLISDMENYVSENGFIFNEYLTGK